MADAIKVTLSADAELQLKCYLRDKIDWLKRTHNDFHTNHLPRWRKFYDAVPKEAVKQWPWPRASNLIVPLVAIHTDTLHARVMSGVFRTIPLWISRSIGEHDGIESLRDGTENFLNYVGIEPSQLDLYRVYNQFYREIIKIGTSFLKIPWVKRIEHQVRMSQSGILGTAEIAKLVSYEGPRPEKIPLENIYIPPNAVHEDQADCIFHRIPLTREELEERGYAPAGEAALYAGVKEVLGSPSRTTPEARERDKQGPVKSESGYGWSEWDVWEGHFRYRVTADSGLSVKGVKSTPEGFYRLICSYHYESNTLLRAVYNFYPDNIRPFVAGRLILRDDAFYGKGYAETLQDMQEEASTVHNQRIDNATIANCRFFTIINSPKFTDAMRFYPGAVLPVQTQDDIKERQLGDVYPSSFENETSVLGLAERMTGISPPMQGYGAGVMQGKRGVYTALGTMSMMQEGNRRSDLALSDLRYPHVQLGRKIRAMYAHFGIPPPLLGYFGKQSEAIKQAFSLEALKKLEIPITAATASINREVERQNLLMLTNQLGTFYQQMGQLLVAINNPQVPPPVREYLIRVANSATNLENQLMKAFDYDDIGRYVPATGFSPESAASAQAGNSPVLANRSGPGASGQLPGTEGALGGGVVQPFYQSYASVPGSGDMQGIGPDTQAPPVA